MLAGAVLVLFFLPLGPFWFQWAVFDLHWGRFADGPFWSVPVLTGRSTVSSFDLAWFSSLSFPTLSCLQSLWCYMYFRDLRSFEIRIGIGRPDSIRK